MTDFFKSYIQKISEKCFYEETSEYGYRTDFENLLKNIFEEINVKRIDHDAKAFKGNKPDYIIRKNDIPILYIETKDIGASLDKIEKSEQMRRYYGYANLVLTDYAEFRFYRNGERYEEPIIIAEYDKKLRTITPKPQKYKHLAKTLIDFTLSHKEPIRSGLHLAKIMGGKAQRIRDNILHLFSEDRDKNDDLRKIYETIKKLLVHDLGPKDFADMYAQTLVYGLFVARFHDKTPDNFSREEARDLIPASNPFLRHFFDHIAGPDFNKRLEYIVNELCEVFSHADVEKLIKDYYKKDLWGDTQKAPDPVIHFYEDFLKEYDPDLRKKMGAYYTPQPVVHFIVRSVDYLLKKEFKLSAGLADTSKIDSKTHRVQILDPAVGTGTFISAVIGNIYRSLLKKKQGGRWPKYVHNDLLPRLHGFEIMMAPYTIAHLKLSMAFKETGFKYFNRRLGIYLTNSLEDVAEQKDMFAFGFAESIAEESRQAAKIKGDTPIMVVIGNPPYSVSSQNKGKWIQNLIKEYKKDLNEKKLNLDDDYIKFIRFAEYFVEKNSSGIVAMITNNSFIDGITHRQMRKHLLETFNNIYILDLHGSSKKKEKTPSRGKDENVFNIQQGVAISIFVRRDKEKNKLGNVYHSDLYGKREEKFRDLNKMDVRNVQWNELKYSEPYYFFVPKDFRLEEEYSKGFKVDELFTIGSSGIESAKDSFIVKFSREDITELKDFINNNADKEIAEKYNIKIEKAIQVKNDSENILDESTEILYRPFDIRYTLYSPNSQGVWWRPRYDVMQHMLKWNLGLIAKRGFDEENSAPSFCAKGIIDRRAWSRPGMQGAEKLFPLYLYSEDGSYTSNLKKDIINKIKKVESKVSPEEIIDYIYAVLHSPGYRKKYKEFLKIDFPRVPYPKNKNIFKKLIKLGYKLRQFHTLESPQLENLITTYPNTGSDTVEKIEYKNGRVYINPEQYFGKVPEIAWNFYIGGYQPARKWLKDRKERTLTNKDLEHYQKIIVALVNTDKLMKKIDELVPKWSIK